MNIKKWLKSFFVVEKPEPKRVVVEGLFPRMQDSEVVDVVYRTHSDDTLDMLKQRSIKLIQATAKQHDVDANLIQAICEKESALYPFAIRAERGLIKQKWYRDCMIKHRFNPDDVINTCSLGLMQILYVNIIDARYEVRNPEELVGYPTYTLKCAIDHLKGLLDRYRLEDALSAYNAGRPWLGNRDTYVRPIMKRYNKLGGV